MTKKLRKIFIIIFILCALIAIEILAIRNISKVDIEETVFVFDKDIPKHTKLTAEHIVKKQFKLLNVPSTAIKDSKNVIGTFAKEDISKGDFVLKNKIIQEIEENVIEVEKGYSLVTVKFDSPDSANAFLVLPNQNVKLIFVPFDTSNDKGNNEFINTEIFDVQIKEIQDVNLTEYENNDYINGKAQYITFKAKESDAIYIIRAKDKGRLEIIS